MGKSIRSKVKRHFRAKKREEGVFAASEAARLQRLSSKLAAVRDAPAPKAELLEGDNEEEGTEGREGQVPGDELAEETTVADTMQLDDSTAKKISTHGRRPSRREEWRASKGLDPRPKPKGMNRIGGLAGRQRAGRPKRRR